MGTATVPWVTASVWAVADHGDGRNAMKLASLVESYSNPWWM